MYHNELAGVPTDVVFEWKTSEPKSFVLEEETPVVFQLELPGAIVAV